MRHILRLLLLVMLLCGSGIVATPARAQTAITPGPCVEGTLPHGALSMFCVPSSGWNGDLVVWAHGYTAFNEPLDFQNLELPGGIYIPDLVQSLGFAFATTSYRTNGLAILEGMDDIRELVRRFPQVAGREPEHTYLTGASEGGIITTLLVEQYPEMFSGGLSACGPIGDFQAQINYVGDFRVLFDYFCPGVIPGGALSVPAEVIENWETVYVPAVKQALAANPLAAVQLIRTARAPIDRADLSTIETTTLGVLWYHTFATNDATEKLRGNPYFNTGRWYSGSANDLHLNLSVPRYEADHQALKQVERYQTSGKVTIPMVILHTTGDEIIPYWHELLYRPKVETSGNGKVTQIPIFRYGHCNFTAGEILLGFALLVWQVTGSEPENITQRPDVAEARRDLLRTQPSIEQ